jgi:phospholipase C
MNVLLKRIVLVISAFAKQLLSITHSRISSVLRFIEDNWEAGRIENPSLDAIAGSMLSMFDFKRDVGSDQGRCDGFDRRPFLDNQTGRIR